MSTDTMEAPVSEEVESQTSDETAVETKEESPKPAKTKKTPVAGGSGKVVKKAAKKVAKKVPAKPETKVAKKAPVKKPVAKAAPKTEKKEITPPTKSSLANLEEGSTRLRLFKALHKFPNGLTASQIKEKTGMLPVSGHLGVLLISEQAEKRIKVEGKGDEDIRGQIYVLTAAGEKALTSGTLEQRKAGVMIGNAWTSERRKAEGKPAKEAPKKSKK